MRDRKIFFLLFMICVSLALPLASCAAGETLYRIEIPFELNESARAVLPDGTQISLGKIVRLPQKSRWPGYSASAWGEPGCVSATAVNALHLLLAVEKERGRTLSVLPLETIAPAAGADAGLVVDAPAGRGLFGAWAPPVGTPVFVRQADGSERALSEIGQSAPHIPQKGDTLVFDVSIIETPYFVEIENRPGGRVVAWSQRDGAALLGRVIHALGGVGRFEGTLFQDSGRLRANHPGVVDISTSPVGQIGGFQIIPWDHALASKEMQGAWDMTQWLIIAPADGKSHLGGTAPLFKEGFVPGPAHGEVLWNAPVGGKPDIFATYGRKSLTLCRLDGGPWQWLPEATGRNDTALAHVTHLRIYFPKELSLPGK